MRKILVTLFVVLSSIFSMGAAAYTVTSGNGLRIESGEYWSKIFGASYRLAQKDPRNKSVVRKGDILYPGDVIYVPKGVKVRIAKVRQTNVATKKPVQVVTVKACDPCVLTKFNQDAFRNSGRNPEAVLVSRGYDSIAAEQLVDAYRSGQCEEYTIAHNSHLYFTAGHKIDLLGKIRYTGYPAEAKKCVAPTGEVMYVPDACENPTMTRPEDAAPRSVPEPTAPVPVFTDLDQATPVYVPPPPKYGLAIAGQPERTAAPPPAPEGPKESADVQETWTAIPAEPVIATPPAIELSQPKEPARLSCGDWDLYINRGGDEAGTGYVGAEGAGYLACKEGENGRHFFGVGAKGSDASGRTESGFDWESRLETVGFAGKYADNGGWDVSYKLLFGSLSERGHADPYVSSRDFDIAGVSLSYNNYQRKLAGERWWPEYGLYLSYFVPTSRHAEHSWNGTAITDTSDLSRFTSLVGLGYRQDIYLGKNVIPFLALGYSAEHPTSESVSGRIGISDTNKIVSASVGINHNLKDSSNVVGWDVGIDVARAVKVARDESRRRQMREALEKSGVVIDDESGGAFMLDTPKQQASPEEACESTATEGWDLLDLDRQIRQESEQRKNCTKKPQTESVGDGWKLF